MGLEGDVGKSFPLAILSFNKPIFREKMQFFRLTFFLIQKHGPFPPGIVAPQCADALEFEMKPQLLVKVDKPCHVDRVGWPNLLIKRTCHPYRT